MAKSAPEARRTLAETRRFFFRLLNFRLLTLFYDYSRLIRRTIEIFSGLDTNMVPADFLHGVSPDCQDVVFSSGGVAALPGLRQPFRRARRQSRYLKTYETPASHALDSNGNLYKETMPGTPSTVASGLIAASRVTAGLSRSRCIKPWLYAPNEWSCSTHLLPDTLIHRSASSLHFPLDLMSYKLYYVNKEERLVSPPVCILWISKGCYLLLFRRPKQPQSGWLFPPSTYCPHDCDTCNLPCKLSRYHVGSHRCGARHTPRRIMRIAAAFYTDFVRFSAKSAVEFVNFFAPRWSIHFLGAINENNTFTTHPRVWQKWRYVSKLRAAELAEAAAKADGEATPPAPAPVISLPVRPKVGERDESGALVIGKSFTGKTARMLHEVRAVPRLCIVDPKCAQLATLKGFEHLWPQFSAKPRGWTDGAVVDYFRAARDRQRFRVVVHVREHFREQLELLCILLRAVGHLTLCVDELGLFIPSGAPGSLPPAITSAMI